MNINFIFICDDKTKSVTVSPSTKLSSTISEILSSDPLLNSIYKNYFNCFINNEKIDKNLTYYQNNIEENSMILVDLEFVQCEFCGNEVSKANLDDHMFCHKIAETEKERFTCSICGKEFRAELKEDHLLGHKIEEEDNRNRKNDNINNINDMYINNEIKQIQEEQKKFDLESKMLKPKKVKLKLNEFILKQNDPKCGNECTVCLNILKFGENVIKLPCNHYFHNNCIKGWINSGRNICPMCKFELS